MAKEGRDASSRTLCVVMTIAFRSELATHHHERSGRVSHFVRVQDQDQALLLTVSLELRIRFKILTSRSPTIRLRLPHTLTVYH